MIRGFDQQNIFHDEADYKKFITILSKYQKMVYYDLYAYCVMGNHVHLLIREGKETLSNSMKRIGVSYVSWHNWQYQRKGPLFQEMFVDIARLWKAVSKLFIKAGDTKNIEYIYKALKYL